MTPTTQDVAAGADDPFDTTVITRLANEFFSESAGSPSLPAWIPALPLSTANGSELSGGYPSASPTTHPPVHAGLQPEATHVPATPRHAIRRTCSRLRGHLPLWRTAL